MYRILVFLFVSLTILQIASCSKDATMADLLIEVEVVESERFELLALPINYIRTFNAGAGNGSIGTLEYDQTKSLSLRDNSDSDFTIFAGPIFPRTVEGIDPSYGLALLRDRQTGEEFELPVCEPRMTPLREITEINAGSSYHIVLPFDPEALHEIDGITYIDQTTVTARVEQR